MKFPKIYYINCEHRVDRRTHLEGELDKLRRIVPELEVIHLSATYIPSNGALGCGLSHIKALEMALNSKDEEVIILEDDFTFREGGAVEMREKIEFLQTGLIDWDVCLLAANLKKHEPVDGMEFYHSVGQAYTTTAYVIRRNYIPRLLKTFTEACEGLIRANTQVPEYCIDTAWQQLQRGDNGKWICTWPLIGYQYPNFSDIEKRETDYRALMCTQKK